MASLNEVTLCGNLCKSPELRYTPNGTAVCDMSLAVNGRKGKAADGTMREEVLFIDVTTWGKTAEAVSQYRRKGDPILIHGRLTYETWQKDGNIRSKHKVIAEKVQFLYRKPDNGGAGQTTNEEPFDDMQDDCPF